MALIQAKSLEDWQKWLISKSRHLAAILAAPLVSYFRLTRPGVCLTSLHVQNHQSNLIWKKKKKKKFCPKIRFKMIVSPHKWHFCPACTQFHSTMRVISSNFMHIRSPSCTKKLETVMNLILILILTNKGGEMNVDSPYASPCPCDYLFWPYTISSLHRLKTTHVEGSLKLFPTQWCPWVRCWVGLVYLKIHMIYWPLILKHVAFEKPLNCFIVRAPTPPHIKT